MKEQRNNDNIDSMRDSWRSADYQIEMHEIFIDPETILF